MRLLRQADNKTARWAGSMYHLYSHNDLDGVGCGILAKVAFGERVEVRYNSVTGLDMQVGRFWNGQKEKKNSMKACLLPTCPFIKKMKKGWTIMLKRAERSNSSTTTKLRFI